MAQHSGFFNALRTETSYDRKYNANDYSDNLAVIIGNGVLRSINDDLKVTAAGMVTSVAAGRAWINGHYYYNDATFDFDATATAVGGNRWDRIVLRLDNSLAARSVSLAYLTGTVASTPTKPELTRSGDVYEICLADIYVTANASSITVTDTRADTEVCGWVYSTSGDNSFFQSLDNSFQQWFTGAKDTLSSVTLFKRYKWTTTLAALSTQVAFDIPQYDPETCFIEVYVNGIFDTRYTLSSNVITFAGSLIAGTVVAVNCYKSIDGTGIQDVADEITELQQEYATISGVSKYTYTCTGLNDNIALSQIAAAINTGSYTVGTLNAAAEAFLQALGGNTWLASLHAEAQITISVVGRLGATTPHAGAGTAASRYRWFSFGTAGASSKKIIFDFAKCEIVNITCAANTDNIIFYGTDLNIRNATVNATSSAAACGITMCVGSSNWGTMNFENCRFTVRTTGKAVIANNGYFRDCILHVKASGENAYCIDAKTDSLVRLHGGTYFAYTGTSNKIASVTNIDAGETNAVIMAENINCPVVAQQGYTQTYFLVSNGGMTQMLGVCTTLNGGGTAPYRNIVGKIEKNKH